MAQEIITLDTTWTVPARVNFVVVQAVGAGGKGATGDGISGSGGGGGGGEYAKGIINGLMQGQTLSLEMGDSTSQKPTTVKSGDLSTTYVLANSGTDAAIANGGTGGTGGTGSDRVRSGGNGGAGFLGNGGGGGGGAAGGWDMAGQNGIAGTGSSGGMGGGGHIGPQFNPGLTAQSPTGAGGTGGGLNNVGVNGSNYGGGGGGSGTNETLNSSIGGPPVIVLDYSEDGIGIDPQSGLYFTGPGCLNQVFSASWSHTVANEPDRYLLVGVAIATSNVTATSVTFGGMDLTFLKAETNGNVRSELWGLVAPNVGTNTVTITFSGITDGEGTAVSFSGVSQTQPIEGKTSAIGTFSDPSITVLVLTDKSLVIDYVVSTNNQLTAGAGQKQIANNSCVAGNGMSFKGPISPPENTTMSWTGNGTWADVALALRPASADIVAPVPVNETNLLRPIYQI